MTMIAPNQFDNLPPHDLAAEMCLLCSMMLAGATVDGFAMLKEIRSIVSNAAFFQADHQTIFKCICAMDDSETAIDAVLLKAELVRRNLLEEIGGVAYLAQVLNSAPSAAHGVHYAKVVREKYQLRQMIGLSNRMIQACYAPHEGDPSGTLAQRYLNELGHIVQSDARHEYQKLDVVMDEVLRGIEAGDVGLIPTGFTALDQSIGGIGPGEMVIVGGRPSMGKSLLTKQILSQMATAGIPVGMITMDETRRKVGRNLLASQAGVVNEKIRKGNLSEEEYRQVYEASETLRPLPFYVCDRAWNIGDVSAVASIWAAKHGVQVIGIDYLQLMESEGRTRYEQVTNSSKAIKKMLRDTGLRGLIVCQLNRAVEGREKKEPTMSDLKESGQLEQDGDGILLLHRPDFYELDSSKRDHIARVIIEKWKDGARGQIVKLGTEMRYQRFTNLSSWESGSEECPV
jgi:replicative DNA helicase